MDNSDFINKKKENYTNLLSDLVRINTVNPPGNEYLVADFLEKFFKKIKINSEKFEKKKGRTNLIVKLGNPEGKKILFATHMDVVPAGDGWDTDPFDPVIKDNLMYGRGTSDNKGPMVSMLLLCEYLKSVEKELSNQFIFVFAADEEKGSTYGLKYLHSESIVNADYVIIPDIGGAMKQISIAEKGALHLNVICKGRQCHGSTPHKGISAIANMSKFISKLDHYILKHELHKYMSRPTINFGTISGGSTINMVAAHCECTLDIRYLPSQKPKDIISELQKLSERFGEFDFEIVRNLPPTEVDDKNVLVKTIQSVCKDHGINAKPKGLNGGTDTKTFVVNDIPAIGFSFVDDYVMHCANEYVNLDNLFKFCDIIIDMCLTLDKDLN